MKRNREWTKWDYIMDKFLMNFKLYRELTEDWEKQNTETDNMRAAFCQIWKKDRKEELKKEGNKNGRKESKKRNT